MKSNRFFLLSPAFRLSLFFLLATLGVTGAQDGVEPDAMAPEETTVEAGSSAPEGGNAVLTLEEIDELVAAMEADSGIEDAVKDAARETYQRAKISLESADRYRSLIESYNQTRISGSANTLALREQLEILSTPEETLRSFSVPDSADAIQSESIRRRTFLAERETELQKLSDELGQAHRRPLEISQRLPEAQKALADLGESTGSLAKDLLTLSTRRAAERVASEAAAEEFRTEIAALEAERVSQPARVELLTARVDLLKRQVENESAIVDFLNKRVRGDLSQDARIISERVSRLVGSVAEDDTAVGPLATEVEELAREFTEVVGWLERSEVKLETVEVDLSQLVSEVEILRSQLEYGRAGGEIARRLLSLRQSLPSSMDLTQKLRGQRREMGELQLWALEVSESLQEKESFEARYSSLESDLVTDLLAERSQLLERLSLQYGNLVQFASLLAAKDEEYLAEVERTRSFLEEELFWVRSSTVFSLGTLAALPEAFGGLISSAKQQEVLGLVGLTLVRMGVPVGIAIAGILVLFSSRKKILKKLREVGVLTRRVRTDRFGFTIQALFLTVLLALPLPLLLLLTSVFLEQIVDGGDWIRSVDESFRISSVVAFLFQFLSASCLKGGLVEVHFRRNAETADYLHRVFRRLVIVFVPSTFLVRLTLTSDSGRYFDSLGQTMMLLSLGFTIVTVTQFFRPGKRPSEVRYEERSIRVRVGLQWILFLSLIAVALMLFVLSFVGYMYTVATLGMSTVASFGIVAMSVLFYLLIERWLRVRERRFALEEALRKRKARQEEASRDVVEEESDEVFLIEEDEDKLDLSETAKQSRDLLRFILWLIVVGWLGAMWSEKIPLISALSEIRFGDGISLLDLCKAILVGLVTATASKNLPGFIDLAILRGIEIQTGTRIAIVTLCQYAIIAIGAVVFFSVLQVDWAQFGWIAAALSVGLGFGLQEVVANFVCGLILLFERPVRVGDVVTVDGTTGTVSRIRMRATTITNWERQELVVPNKNFVTGAILNWTLSSSINRILIEVGIAYGSDTNLAREILLNVAKEHPDIVESPAPLATFEEFAASCLTLRLRAYLPDMDRRLGVITELHDAIGERFSKAGIEISFPQRDIHIRTITD